MAGLLLLLLTNSAVGQSASSAPASTAPAQTAAPARPAPEVPPASVADAVNPFADDKNLPTPIKWPTSGRPRINVDIHPELFDGLTVLVTDMNGPDFAWQFESLDDWMLTPPGYGESAAFVFRPQPKVRLSFVLFGPGELLPSFSADGITHYLAAIRAVEPKQFVLLTPISNNTKLLSPESFAGFQAQSVDYAIVSTDIVMHHEWFLDLNGQYVLQVALAGPSALVDKVLPSIKFFLNRSTVRKGLNTRPPSPTTPAAPAATASASAAG